MNYGDKQWTNDVVQLYCLEHGIQVCENKRLGTPLSSVATPHR